MMYAKSESDYSLHRGEFESLCGHGGRTKLCDFFVSNLDRCKNMWVMAFRSRCHTSTTILTTGWRSCLGS
ncbi:hypothetical protein GQ600_4224 [Phytophthora cactorum]|nr:hypothetical protein GQ600_4224 [Phytophthora cactorum]